MENKSISIKDAKETIKYSSEHNEVLMKMLNLIEMRMSEIDSIYLTHDYMGAFQIELYNLYTNEILTIFPHSSGLISLFLNLNENEILGSYTFKDDGLIFKINSFMERRSVK